jgi:predicted amidohydrolase YtcJ
MKKISPYTIIALASLICIFKTNVYADDASNLILINAKIYTVNEQKPWAEAVVIDDGKIIFVGDNQKALQHKNNNSQIKNMQGKMILPGFHDIHVHPVHAGVTYLQCNLSDIRGLENLLRMIKFCAKNNTNNDWVLGGGWAVDNFTANTLPDKKLLDQIIPNKPISLKSSDGHSLWVNSKALEMSGINAQSEDPANGKIERYKGTMEPSGLLHEDSAMMLIMQNQPQISNEELIDGLRYSVNLFHSYGITGVQDAILKLEPGDAYYGLNAYNYLESQNELNLHVVTAMFWENGQPLKPQLKKFINAREQQKSSDLIHVTAVKIWQDGVIETYTAAMLEPYSDRVDNFRGELQNSPRNLNKAVAALDAEGFQIHFHAIGDRAINVAFNSLEKAIHINGIRDSRHHISHIQVFQENDISRFKELGVVANFQPLWGIRDEYITEHTYKKLGKKRSQWLYPIGSVHRSGAKIGFGSDWYVTSANPLDGIEAAVTRLEPNGLTKIPLGNDEAINLATAIRAYTLNGAFVNFLDHKVGSIEIGKQADIIVLNNNLFDIPSAEINETKVLATYFNGKLVYGEL